MLKRILAARALSLLPLLLFLVFALSAILDMGLWKRNEEGNRGVIKYDIISYYSFRYPASGLGPAARAAAVTGAYAAAALVVALLAHLVAWLRRRKAPYGTGDLPR